MKALCQYVACIILLLPAVALAQFQGQDAEAHFSHPLEIHVQLQFPGWTGGEELKNQVIKKVKALPNVVVTSVRPDFVLILTGNQAANAYTCSATVLQDARDVVGALYESRVWSEMRKRNLVKLEDIAEGNEVVAKTSEDLAACYLMMGCHTFSKPSATSAFESTLNDFDQTGLEPWRKSDRGMRSAYDSNKHR